MPTLFRLKTSIIQSTLNIYGVQGIVYLFQCNVYTIYTCEHYTDWGPLKIKGLNSLLATFTCTFFYSDQYLSQHIQQT